MSTCRSKSSTFFYRKYDEIYAKIYKLVYHEIAKKETKTNIQKQFYKRTETGKKKFFYPTNSLICCNLSNTFFVKIHLKEIYFKGFM